MLLVCVCVCTYGLRETVHVGEREEVYVSIDEVLIKKAFYPCENEESTIHRNPSPPALSSHGVLMVSNKSSEI